MDEDTQRSCKSLLCEYQEDPTNIDLRNSLFIVVHKDVIKWIKSWHARHNQFVSPQEILSETWDCFLYCIDNYTDWNVPVPSHFTRYINWHLSAKGRKDRMGQSVETGAPLEIPEEVSLDDSVGNIRSTGDLLKNFREFLEEKERGIFDDALLNSMKHKDEHPLGKYTYVKATLRKVIMFFLKE